MLQLSHPSLSNVVTCCRFFHAFSYSHRQTPIMLHPQFQDDARVPPNFWFCAKATLNLCQWELLAWLKNRHITAKYQIEGRESSTYRNYSCHFAGFRIFILQRQGAGRWSWGGGGLTGTPIEMSSFYLWNEFFLSLELRRHSETNLHYDVSPLADANVQ